MIQEGKVAVHFPEVSRKSNPWSVWRLRGLQTGDVENPGDRPTYSGTTLVGGYVEKQARLLALLCELEQDTSPLWVSPAMVMLLP